MPDYAKEINFHNLFNVDYGILLTALGLLLTIMGIILTIRSIKKHKLSYHVLSDRIFGGIDSVAPKLSSYYDSVKINRLNRSYVIIWNSGTEVINGSDVVEKEPISIIVKDGRILSATVIKINNDSNQFGVNIKSPDKAIINFDYLNKGDGCVIEILHDSNNLSPFVKGIIKGIQKGLSNEMASTMYISKNPLFIIMDKILNYDKSNMYSIKSNFSKVRVRKYVLSILMFIIGMSSLKIGFSDSLCSKHDNLNIVFIFIGLFYIVTPIFLLFLLRHKYPSSLNINE